MSENKVKQLKDLNLKKLREKVKDIKAQLSEEERNVITYSK